MSKYLTQLGQYNTDRSMDVEIYRGQVGDNQWQQSFDFQQDQEAYRRDQDERDRQYQTDSGKAALLYTAGDPSGYAALWGLTPEETQLLVDSYAEQKQLTQDAAARELAEFHARYGDISKLKEIGVDTSRMERAVEPSQTQPTLKGPQENAYNELLNDLVALRQEGATANEINGVLLQARREGTISYEQLKELRGAYIGSGR